MMSSVNISDSVLAKSIDVAADESFGTTFMMTDLPNKAAMAHWHLIDAKRDGLCINYIVHTRTSTHTNTRAHICIGIPTYIHAHASVSTYNNKYACDVLCRA